MKKLLFLFTVITLLSCSKNEDDNSSVATASIVGKWHLTTLLENGKPITGYTCDTNLDITEFTSGGQSINKYARTTPSNACIQETDNGNYTITDNILTDVQKSGNVTIFQGKYKIKELTATSLKLETISVFEGSSNGGTEYNINYTEGEEVYLYTKI